MDVKFIDMVKRNGKVDGNLIGVDSNVFAIIGYAESALRGNWNNDDVSEFVNQCMNASSYEEVIAMCNFVLE